MFGMEEEQLQKLCSRADPSMRMPLGIIGLKGVLGVISGLYRGYIGSILGLYGHYRAQRGITPDN